MSEIKYLKEYNMDVPIDSKEFLEIIDFYLFKCPVLDISMKGENLKDMGFTNKKLIYLYDDLIENSTLIDEQTSLWCIKDDVGVNVLAMESITPTNEYSIFYRSENKNVTRLDSLFSAIRNSLAHGGFSRRDYDGEKVYFLENYAENKLSAQMILKEETLLKWIKIVKKGPRQKK